MNVVINAIIGIFKFKIYLITNLFPVLKIYQHMIFKIIKI